MTGPIELPVGSTTVQLSAPGYPPSARTVTINAGALSRETIVLQAPSSSVNGLTSTADQSPSGTRSGEPGQEVAQREEGSSTRRRIGWIALGGSALLAAGGGAALIFGKNKAQWFTDAAHGCSVSNGSPQGSPDCKDAYNSGHTARVIGATTLVAAGLLGIGSAILLVTGRKGSDHPAAVSLACSPIPTGLGISCGSRF